MIFKETIAFRWPLIRKKQRQNLHNVPKRLFFYMNLFCFPYNLPFLGSNQSFKSKTPLIWQLFYQTLGISKKNNPEDMSIDHRFRVMLEK